MPVLLIDRNLKDLSLAANTVNSVGFTAIELRDSYESAQSWLEGRLEADPPLPHVIVLDLDLGLDSGYDLLRFWYFTPALAKTHVIVWTDLPEENRKICELFNVHFYIPKWEGAAALRKALQMLRPNSAPYPKSY
jgi:DNA-binding response OmpR family regulator